MYFFLKFLINSASEIMAHSSLNSASFVCLERTDYLNTVNKNRWEVFWRILSVFKSFLPSIFNRLVQNNNQITYIKHHYRSTCQYHYPNDKRFLLRTISNIDVKSDSSY